MGFLSKIFRETKRFVRDTIKIAAPIAGAIVGGPAGFAAGTVLAGFVAKRPSGGAAPTAPPAAPRQPQIGLGRRAAAPTAAAAPPGAFGALFTGMTPLLLIGGVVIAFVVFRGR